MLTRVISRIDVKNEYVIKGIHLEGLRKVGDPKQIALQYYQQGIDEILLMDAVASLYDRNNLFHIVNEVTNDIFVPIAVGGGIRTSYDIDKALQVGADKVAINTAAVRNPKFIAEASRFFGSQCIIGSIEAKSKGKMWEVYVDNGRESTGINVVEWAKQLEQLGVGEILLTSVDQEGTKNGFAYELIRQIEQAVDCPIIISGGYGRPEHIKMLAEAKSLSAIAIASALHYKLETVTQIKHSLQLLGMEVRI